MTARNCISRQNTIVNTIVQELESEQWILGPGRLGGAAGDLATAAGRRSEAGSVPLACHGSLRKNGYVPGEVAGRKT